MKALVWNGTNDLAVETVDDPTILNPHDVIVAVRLTTTCGSDLHFIDGYLPGMRAGDVFGHEFMGEVVEVGAEVTDTKVGARVVVPSFIACNRCWYCDHDLYSLCDTTNPNAELQRPILGSPTAGIYGYTHPFGGYAGSHAQYIRVPFGDVNCFAIPDFVTDEQALFMSDAVPTGYMGADFCDIAGGDTVAVWGAGAVGLMAARSALLNGAGRVISIDRYPERLALAQQLGAETINYAEIESVQEALGEATGGRGPDAVIEAVGMEGHSTGVRQVYDRAKQALRMETDRAAPLREAILACRKGGVVSVLGIYGLTDKFPMGMLTNKSLTLRTAQQHGQRYIPQFFDYVAQGDLDPSILITHDLPLHEGVRAYDMFKNKTDGCIRVVLRP
ncbi:glutathione-dependent formaldehyde dehydrogenase [Mycolicibacterium wolinskyi]|uniref:Glutathione-dependent formaldehyde dehydrogenase n=1 Tax=Mycolicibacterium wolinskyi TaxID=59750 RepID=A0A1X2F095_9MYCO|nr:MULTISPECIES: zinc-dependent alcohol dehydrogenase [Mycolicibacterium]MCV7288654.1 glutathione-dependent formaldehyde dehydrogenase [Mycolicibacterium wolinskyi]MCV7295876.1 glutathione-dependent formaldehyde dehydrogenase [Mycolicibacterium goodii]ORX11863.1 glutathione-dependent formaldehyde dehydrogenase [Mycolicibacterium wolinskyi]